MYVYKMTEMCRIPPKQECGISGTEPFRSDEPDGGPEDSGRESVRNFLGM